jgi:hypothetical protein
MSRKSFVFFGFSSRLRDEDGHLHVTKTKRGKLVGGNKAEHERLQDIGIGIEKKMDEIEKKHGELGRVEFERISDAVAEVLDKHHK